MTLRTVRAWLHRLWGMVRRDRRERELDAELEAHLQLHIDDSRRLGLSAEDARRRALIMLGGLQSTRELYRERRTVPFVENVVRDVRYGWRSLRRSPMFTVAATATLALGIGGTTAIFAVVDSVLLRPLPFRDPDRLVMIWERPPQSDRRNVTSMQNYVAWRERSRSFERLAAFDRFPANLIGPDESIQVTGARVTAEFFSLLGVDAVLGRTFAAGEDEPSFAPVAVVSHGLWLRRFGGRADVIGRRISVNGRHHEIVGVTPAGLSFPDQRAQIFVPLRVSPLDGRSYSVVARLAPTVTLPAAREEMTAIAARLAHDHPESNAKWSASVVPLHEQIVGDVRRPLLLLFMAVGFVMLIACANVGSLMLMRSTTRLREMDVRLALGAARWRLLQQLTIESLLLAGFGAVLGLTLAWAAIKGLAAVPTAVPLLPRQQDISIDARVLLFAAGAAIAAAFLFGVVPELRSRRRSGPLRAADRRATSAHRRMQALMVVGEIALALPLLAGAGLMVRSFIRLSDVDPGFRAEGVLTVRMLLLPARDRAFHAEFVNDALERVRALPGVIAAGSIARLPLDGANMGSWYYRADRPEPSPGDRPAGDISLITPGYFHAMGIPMRRGRDFDERDRIGSAPVAIVNETAARAFFGGEDPIGKRLAVSWNDAREVEIVGVAGDIRHGHLQARPAPCLFMPNAQQPFPFSALVIRTAGDPAVLAPAVRAEIHHLDPDQGVGEIQTMEQIVGEAKAQPRVQTMLFALFGVVALMLTSLGIYGVLAYSVTQRAREIGVRIALGASPVAAFRFVLRDGLRLTGAGVALGLIAAVVLTRFMQGLLFEVQPFDLLSYACVTGLLVAVAAAACAIPASRASLIDPAVVLRAE